MILIIFQKIFSVIQKEKQFSLFDSFIRGCRLYIEIWTPKVRDDSLCLKCEDGNEHSNYAMAVMIRGRTGEHAPKN